MNEEKEKELNNSEKEGWKEGRKEGRKGSINEERKKEGRQNEGKLIQN